MYNNRLVAAKELIMGFFYIEVGMKIWDKCLIILYMKRERGVWHKQIMSFNVLLSMPILL